MGAPNSRSSPDPPSDLSGRGLGMKPTLVCSIEDCEDQRLARGLCSKHYCRWKKNKQNYLEGPAELVHLRDRGCLVDGCDSKHSAQGYCMLHYNRWKSNGSPHIVQKIYNENLTYSSAHDRVRSTKGRASQYLCQHCGRSAEHWAYDGKDVDQFIDLSRIYSLKPDHYTPLCAKCHKTYDAKPVRQCSVDDCERKHYGRGLCNMHWQRQRK
jgi:hypothetical protein